MNLQQSCLQQQLSRADDWIYDALMHVAQGAAL